MRRPFGIAAAFVLLSTACLGGGGGDERTVLVDYNHDEFNTIMLDNFPGDVTIAAGGTVVFKQVWTGEPHTVTAGTLVDKEMQRTRHLMPFGEAYDQLRASGVDIPDPEGELPEGLWADVIDEVKRAPDRTVREQWRDSYEGLREQGLKIPPFDDPGSASIAEVIKVIDAEFVKIFESGEGLPYALAEDEEGNFGVAQNAGQPCYLESGGPPKEADKACDENKQRQPDFDGTHSYYNSGIIPYEGPQGNTFRVPIDERTKPGDYWFMCAVHGAFQSTLVTVVAPGTEVPSQSEVSRQARKEIAAFVKPMTDVFNDARDGRLDVEGTDVRAPFGGLSAPVHGGINEFVPKDIDIASRGAL